MQHYKKISDKYHTGKQIATLAFGKAYKCWLRRDIAEQEGLLKKNQKQVINILKVIKKSLWSLRPLNEDLLVEEFQVLLDARHQNIARVYDVFQDKKNFYVVQELIPGDDLYVTLGERIFTEDEAI